MKLSIITTIYQAEKDLPRLLDSMMAQKSPELEFFLIDNGCTDRSAAICKEYAAKDKRFTIYTLKENICYIGARNLGLQMVEADYIGFSDSDDYLQPGGYDNAIQKIKETHCDMYICGWNTAEGNAVHHNTLPIPDGIYTNPHEEILPYALGPSKGHRMLYGFMWKQILRRDLIHKYNISFSQSLKPFEDMLFNATYISHVDSVCIDSNVLYNYVNNPDSITRKLLFDYDFTSDYKRLTSLYQELKKLSINQRSIGNCANLAVYNIYASLLAGAKQKKYTKRELSKIFAQTIDAKLIHQIYEESTNISMNDKLICYCLKNKLYTPLLLLISTSVRLRDLFSNALIKNS
jgi:glycosyltransferase involved in cell wall biosynthesis